MPFGLRNSGAMLKRQMDRVTEEVETAPSLPSTWAKSYAEVADVMLPSHL